MKKNVSLFLSVFWACFLCETLVWGASFYTKNFTVTTSDPRNAELLANRAEELRARLAIFWLGKELPNWYRRCQIKIDVRNTEAAGSTVFTFENGEVFGWEMDIRGTVERLYDSVLPHEITHMILASHFRMPVPRWADEGAATFTEHESERSKYRQKLYAALKSGKGIPFDRLFTIEEYPDDPFPLYAHGFSITEFLIRQRGPHYFIAFVDACMNQEQTWDQLVYDFYGYTSLRNLQNDWVAWVKDGSNDFIGTNMIAGNGSPSIPLRIGGMESQELAANHDIVKVVPSSRVRPKPNMIKWNTTHTPAE